MDCCVWQSNDLTVWVSSGRDYQASGAKCNASPASIGRVGGWLTVACPPMTGVRYVTVQKDYSSGKGPVVLAEIGVNRAGKHSPGPRVWPLCGALSVHSGSLNVGGRPLACTSPPVTRCTLCLLHQQACRR